MSVSDNPHLKKWIHKHPVLFLVLAGILVVLELGFGIFLWRPGYRLYSVFFLVFGFFGMIAEALLVRQYRKNGAL